MTVLVVILFLIVRSWNHPTCSSKEECIKRMWLLYSFTGASHSAVCPSVDGVGDYFGNRKTGKQLLHDSICLETQQMDLLRQRGECG